MDYLVNNAEDYLINEAENENLDVSIDTGVRYHNIIKDDMRNGEGLQTTIFFSGCPCHCKDENGSPCHCKECHNPETWDEKSGLPFTRWEEAEFFEALDKPWCTGATFSGGDPLHPANRNYVGNLARIIKETRPDKAVWLYTGYTLIYEGNKFSFTDEAGASFDFDAIKNVDVLCDGAFKCEVRRADIASGNFVPWVGSSNQRVIDLKASVEQGRIVRRMYDKRGNYSLI